MEPDSGMLAKDYTLKLRLWRRYSTPWQKIVSHPYEGSGTEENPYIVTWLHDGDDENPLKWSSGYQCSSYYFFLIVLNAKLIYKLVS
jgi:hypothetical protein